YGTDFQNVVGMEEYHNGDAEEISGLERVDDYTLTITYHNFNNSLLQAGGGVSSYIEPEHLLGEVPVAELEDSEYVRTNPVGFGPFQIESITPGESVTFSGFMITMMVVLTLMKLFLKVLTQQQLSQN